MFQTELLINNNLMLSDIHRNVLAAQEGNVGQHQPVSARFYQSSTNTDRLLGSSQVSYCEG
jgi:hypothetical protein